LILGKASGIKTQTSLRNPLLAEGDSSLICVSNQKFRSPLGHFVPANRVEQLKMLNELRTSGALSEEEFQEEKRRVHVNS